jgi:hypothetical protein
MHGALMDMWLVQRAAARLSHSSRWLSLCNGCSSFLSEYMKVNALGLTDRQSRSSDDAMIKRHEHRKKEVVTEEIRKIGDFLRGMLRRVFTPDLG